MKPLLSRDLMMMNIFKWSSSTYYYQLTTMTKIAACLQLHRRYKLVALSWHNVDK